eukprot:6075582-Amphidinium_carterae.1
MQRQLACQRRKHLRRRLPASCPLPSPPLNKSMGDGHRRVHTMWDRVKQVSGRSKAIFVASGLYSPLQSVHVLATLCFGLLSCQGSPFRNSGCKWCTKQRHRLEFILT